MSFSTASKAWVAVAAVSLVGIAAVAGIAYRHYRSSLATFERGPPNSALATTAAAGVVGLREVSLRTPRGTVISAWHSPSRNGASVLLIHGTNADRSALMAELRFLSAQGFGVLAYDGPGYGRSGGEALWGAESEAAARAAIDWLDSHEPIGHVRIGGLGHSMGGYTLVQAASNDSRIESLVLEAVPPNVVDTTRWQHRKWGAVSEWPALRALRFAPELLARPTAADLIKELSPRPLLVISGDQDETVPLFMTEAFFDRAAGAKELWVLPGAGHGDFAISFPERYPARVIEFFTRTLLSNTNAGGDFESLTAP